MDPSPAPGIRTRLWVFLGTGFGSGYVPGAPGTAGSLVGVLLVWPLLGLSLPVYLVMTLAITLIGIVAADRTAEYMGRKDPGAVVIDEIAGIMITLIGATATLPELLIGFALFRLFDIWKPPPCRWAERNFAGGLGIMADDLMAGVYACICLTLLRTGLGW